MGAFHDDQAAYQRRKVYRLTLGLTELGLGIVLIASDELSQPWQRRRACGGWWAARSCCSTGWISAGGWRRMEAPSECACSREVGLYLNAQAVCL
jgi:hypothetical protein